MSKRDRGAGSAQVEPAPIAYLPWVQSDASSSSAGAVKRDLSATHQVEPPQRTEPALEDLAQEIEVADRADELVLKKLARHGLSEYEVRQQLRAGLEEHDVEASVERYQRLGYLDDSRLAEAFVRVATGRKGLGPGAIRRELLARGIDPEIIAQALTDLNAEAELEAAIDLIQRRVQRSGESRTVLERRLFAQLQRKGYSSSIARRAIEEVFATPS